MPRSADTEFVVTRLLREALEGVVAPGLVSPILFEALEPYGAKADLLRDAARFIVARRK